MAFCQLLLKLFWLIFQTIQSKVIDFGQLWLILNTFSKILTKISPKTQNLVGQVCRIVFYLFTFSILAPKWVYQIAWFLFQNAKLSKFCKGHIPKTPSVCVSANYPPPHVKNRSTHLVKRYLFSPLRSVAVFSNALIKDKNIRLSENYIKNRCWSFEPPTFFS